MNTRRTWARTPRAESSRSRYSSCIRAARASVRAANSTVENHRGAAVVALHKQRALVRSAQPNISSRHNACAHKLDFVASIPLSAGPAYTPLGTDATNPPPREARRLLPSGETPLRRLGPPARAARSVIATPALSELGRFSDPRLVRPLMEHPSLRRQPVLLPDLLDMDKPPLPLAEHQVLQGRRGAERSSSENMHDQTKA